MGVVPALDEIEDCHARLDLGLETTPRMPSCCAFLFLDATENCQVKILPKAVHGLEARLLQPFKLRAQWDDVPVVRRDAQPLPSSPPESLRWIWRCLGWPVPDPGCRVA
jgi:hypothetical protein